MSLTDLMSSSKAVKDLKIKIKGLAEKNFDYCFICGKCTGGCTSISYFRLEPHKVVNMTKLGLVNELLTSDVLWVCTQCHKCTERCPQKVSPYDLIMLLRREAFKSGLKRPASILLGVRNILKNGFILDEQTVFSRDLDEFNRETLSLPEIPRPSKKFLKKLSDFISLGGEN